MEVLQVVRTSTHVNMAISLGDQDVRDDEF